MPSNLDSNMTKDSDKSDHTNNNKINLNTKSNIRISNYKANKLI